MTSISMSSHLRRTAAGKRAGSSAVILFAKCSATAMRGSSVSMGPRGLGARVSGFKRRNSGVAQPDAAEAGNLIDGGDDRKGDDEHDEAQQRDPTQIAAFGEIEDEDRDDPGLPGEQD